MGSTAEQLRCDRDGSLTRLTCVECGLPICPLCLVRTPVGMKCATCGGDVVAAAAAHRNRRRWPLVVVPLAVAGLGVAAAAVLSSPDKPARSTVNPSAENRPAAPYTFGGIGREVVDGDLSFLVKSVDCGAAEVAAATPRTAQGQFCVLTLAIRNVSRAPVTFDAKNQALEDATRRRFAVDAAATSDHPANAGVDMLMPVVNPGNDVTGVLVFDLPPDTRPVSVSLHAGSAGFGAIVLLP